jgi:N-acetylmuramoyl-L-alanine amidase
MKFFKFGVKRNAIAQGFRPKTTPSHASFILEPILTPTAGIDGTEGTPDLALASLTTLPTVDLPQLDFADDVTATSAVEPTFDLDRSSETIDFIDALPDFASELDTWFDSGVFTVGESGEVAIDFLFDGGGFQGELAIFSLDGMEDLQPGSDAFIKEVAQRALSSSTLGHVVVSDAADAARFSGSLPWEGDFNSGNYQGVQTFQMRPGDRLGFMLVPNNTVQAVFANPCDEGIRPLFSMSTANPDDHFQAGQMADVTGDDNTFVFEDLRLDANSDRDYNDMVFQVRGATSDVVHLDNIIDPNRDWRNFDMGKALVTYAESYINPELEQTVVVDVLKESQPLIGIIDTGFAANNPDIDYSRLILGRDRIGNDNNPLLQSGENGEHGTHVLGIIGATQDNGIGIDGANDDAPIWLGRAVGSGQWADSLIEFVDSAKASGQPNAVVNLSFDLAQINPDGSISTRFEFTSEEVAAIEYARQHNVLIVAAAGNDGAGISALGEASRQFDNVITVGSAEALGRADYSSYGYELDILASGGTSSEPVISTVADGTGTMAGTSVATAKVTGAISQVWATNPSLSYLQVIEILKSTAKDLGVPNWDAETGAGLLNVAAAINLAKVTPGRAVSFTPVEIESNWLDESVFTPIERAVNGASLMGKRIVLDPGHGITNAGFDPGALGPGTTEAAENLVQAGIVANYLRQRGATVTVVNEQLSLAQIGQRASGSDLFVSLHLNAFNRSAQGHEVLVRTNATGRDLALANAINSELDAVFPDHQIPNRDVKRQNVSVLRNAPLNVPAVLTEALFIDAPGMSRANVEKAAEAIARGVEKFLTGRTTPPPIRPQPEPTPIDSRIGRGSRSPRLFQEAYIRINGRERGLVPTGDAQRRNGGWIQEFRDSRGDRFLLTLEDNANQAFLLQYGNLIEYEFMGGPEGRELDGRRVFLGYPRSDENPIQRPDGRWAVWQAFSAEDGTARIHYLAREGVGSVATWGGIGRFYTNMGGAGSFLGMPTRREYFDGDTVFADFEGGRIAYRWNDAKTEALRPGEQPSWRRQGPPMSNPIPERYRQSEEFFNWARGQQGIRRLDGLDGLRGQCVSLIARYVQEVFLPPEQRTVRRAFGHGKDTASVVARMVPNAFEPYTKEGLPKRGAIISFPGPDTRYGHTAIVMESRIFNGRRQVRIMDSNGDNRGVSSTVREQSRWIDIDSTANGYRGTNGWTNPR